MPMGHEHCIGCSPMLSSAEQSSQHSSHIVSHSNNNNNNNNLNRIHFSSSPPPPPTPSSSSSASSPTSKLHYRHPRTMEEVWRDISLANLHDNPLSITTQHNNHHHHHMSHEPRLRTHQSHNRNPNCNFQDFLNRPLINQEAPTSLSMNGGDTSATGLYGSPLPPPATVLSLIPGAGFEFLENPDPLVAPTSLRSHHQVSSLKTPLEALVTSARLGCFGKKRGHDSDGGSSDRRHKRMIKNRESAARSRARKQAYTNELEIEVAYLQAENARLKIQQNQLRMAAASLPPKKNMLQRASSAPF